MSGFLPEIFEKRMKLLLLDSYEEFEKSYEKDRHRGLRANLLKENESGEDARSVLKKDASLKMVPWNDSGFYYDEENHPGKHPFHEAGVYYIQEPSAMVPGVLIDAQPGEKVLDLCAAPGGKTTQIAASMKGKGLLVTNEINSGRAKILAENVERMGIRNAVVTNETSGALAKRFEGFFDRIMVDAPCSGEGMFRKNDEALSEWSYENVIMCAERQAQILDDAAVMLKPGGRIVYSTCTFAPEENEISIIDFLERHPDFELVSNEDMKEKLGSIQELNFKNLGGTDTAQGWKKVSEEVVQKTFRLWPHKLDGEGHFAAVLEKKSENSISDNVDCDTPVKNSDIKKIKEYLGDILQEECFSEDGILGTGRLETFGENVYLVPTQMIALGGLRIMRAGLHLGTLQKNRFEPAHALALAIRPCDAKRTINLSLPDAQDYIKGLTKNVEADKGWMLVLADGFSLAWGKNAGGILKNHYPKGLRKG